MIKSRFFKVYINNRINPALGINSGSPSPGVYLVKQGEEITYVGFSGYNVYKTLTRHFQSWEDGQHRTTFKNRNSNNITARVIKTTAAQAANLEKALILKYKPRHNKNKLDAFQLDASDKRLIESYENTPSTNEAPPF